jgi:hypothetical protein
MPALTELREESRSGIGLDTPVLVREDRVEGQKTTTVANDEDP